MVTAVRIAAVAVLVCIAAEDIRYKKISGTGILLFFMVNTMLLLMMECSVYEKCMDLAAAVLFGGSFYTIAIATKEAIGKGDAFLIMGAGVSLGYVGTAAVVLLALILVLIYGIIGVAGHKIYMKQKVAFVPFLCLAYGIVQKGMIF